MLKKGVLEQKLINQYIIVDVEELHNFLKKNQLVDVSIQDLRDNLDWNIVLPKKA